MAEATTDKGIIRYLINLFGDKTSNKHNKNSYVIIVVLILVSILSYYIISKDEGYYKNTIAKITSVTETKDHQSQDMNGNVEQIYKQNIKAIIVNGKYKGTEIQLTNITSYSQTYDLKYKVNDEVFISISESADNQIVSAKILDLKRDKYIAYIAILFILLILLIGGMKGLRSLTSVIVNIIIFSIAIELYKRGWNLIVASSIASLFFIVISISLVSGINKKTLSAMIGTVAGTLFSMIVTLIVIAVTNGNGIHYEEMEFLTLLPYKVFIVEILIGTLGGIMDIAISISSAIHEMVNRNPCIERKALLKSGLEIGKDIMGTMSNTLVFAYISGSIPMILLLLRNGYSIFNVISFNLSLEIVRALTGSIGIVVSIPITLYISVLLLRKNTTGDVNP